jgi:Uma2 family endonuclease
MSAAEKLHRATYADLEAVPAHRVAELIGGMLHVMPRPAPRHANAEGAIVGELRGPFQYGRGGPGGWWILPEPELHFPDPTGANPFDAMSPDVAGWRRERIPELPSEAFFTLAPDWICEVLSTSTEKIDRQEKMPAYAREGVQHAWLVDPIKRTVELFSLLAGRVWSDAVTHRGDARVRLAPFEAIELDLSLFWA